MEYYENIDKFSGETEDDFICHSKRSSTYVENTSQMIKPVFLISVTQIWIHPKHIIKMFVYSKILVSFLYQFPINDNTASLDENYLVETSKGYLSELYTYMNQLMMLH